jgi:hypothetical protein
MTRLNPSRRAALFTAITALLPLLPAQGEPPPDASFRYRWSTLDALFEKARQARKQNAMPLSTYSAIVRMLHEEEEAIFRQAAAHSFQSIDENDFWRRGKLKFPSSLRTEVRLLGEGKDPAKE